MALARSPESSLGLQIRRLRRQHLGLTQKELAAELRSRTGTTPSPMTVSRWERDVFEPSLYYLRQIAELAEIPLSELFGGNGGQALKTKEKR